MTIVSSISANVQFNHIAKNIDTRLSNVFLNFETDEVKSLYASDTGSHCDYTSSLEFLKEMSHKLDDRTSENVLMVNGALLGFELTIKLAEIFSKTSNLKVPQDMLRNEACTKLTREFFIQNLQSIKLGIELDKEVGVYTNLDSLEPINTMIDSIYDSLNNDSFTGEMMEDITNQYVAIIMGATLDHKIH